jgi:hypothetical protein
MRIYNGIGIGLNFSAGDDFPDELSFSESTGLDISVSTSWQEIIRLTQNETETTNLSTSIDNIVWEAV